MRNTEFLIVGICLILPMDMLTSMEILYGEINIVQQHMDLMLAIAQVAMKMKQFYLMRENVFAEMAYT